MPEVDLLLSLAEIAGVFVGFGALIAVRSAGPREASEITPVRGVLMAGMATIVAALAPVTIGRYDLTDHQVLALSSVVALATYIGFLYIHTRSPEYREAVAAMPPYSRRRTLVEGVAFVGVIGGPVLALIAIALGVVPGIEAALYFTVVVFFVVQAAWTLLWLAFRQRSELRAPEPSRRTA